MFIYYLIGFFICWFLIALLVLAIHKIDWIQKDWRFYAIFGPVLAILFPFIYLIKAIRDKFSKKEK